MTTPQIGTETVVAQATGPLIVAMEEAKKGDLVPVVGLSPVTSDDKLMPVAPKWMKQTQAAEAHHMADALIADVKASPADVRLLTRAQTIGREGERSMVQPLALYQKKVAVAFKANQEGNKTNQTILDVKRNIDLVNPAVIRAMPIAKRWTLGIVKHLPNGEEVLKKIYENRETVESTINGLVESLRVDAEAKEADIEDIATIYSGLLTAQQLIERDVYVGQLVIQALKKHLTTMEAGPEKDNVSNFVADLTTAVIFRMNEENANLQFFAGAQNFAKLATAQIHLLRNMAPLLQRSVMAALGLNVANAELATSMKLTGDIAEAIGNTLASTARNQEEMVGHMIEMRSKGGISLDRLEEACSTLERVFEKQAQANQLIIEQGGTTMRRLADMSARLRSRVEGGHESMVGSKPAQITAQGATAQ